ncbi:hypothetical protein G3N30_08635 [Microbacterium lacticum]|uniref:hypothetical protein n=1 Tax=Microbacterium lacticum TaxID=33885 RepID=UPI0018B098B5|nr:hypothetical protein [Microbacterium lacticum]MBF9336286.1 hypothetical protein [Microbacterium lacticum]
MDDPNALELTALRRRAYGPDADIDADPAALARLRKLEEQDRARAAASEARAEGAAEAVAQPDEPAERAPALTAVAAAGDATGDPAADTAADMTGDARTPWSMFGQGDDDCLFVVADQRIGDDGSIRGPIYTGCRAGSFPATAEFLVGIDSPQQLRDRFGDGTALQFVLDGGIVGVFVGAPVPSPTPTTTA